MKIYVGHAGREKWDFESLLYAPLLSSDLVSNHEFILPYQHIQTFHDSENIIRNCNLLLAEVFYPSTGLGIEMAWARQYNVPVIAIHHDTKKPTSSLEVITKDVFSYQDSNQMLEILYNLLSQQA
jgi:hypothetical protein